MGLLLLTNEARAKTWKRVFDDAGEEIILSEAAVSNPAAVSCLACWVPPADLSVYPNLKALLSTGAGVDQMPPLPEGVALVRCDVAGISEMVRDWVLMAVLMLQRQMSLYLQQARAGQWETHLTRSASAFRVGIMGMGRIGQLAARALGACGFDVAGYSRSGRPVEGCEIYGPDRLAAFLGRTDILVCLLPLTAETRGMLNADLFAQLPDGAMLVHAGRGAQLDMAALRGALDSGRLASAMIDVTDPEPLPEGHWAWTHPQLIVTPHIGAETDAEAGAQHALEVVRALRAGAPIPGQVDRDAGY